MRVRSAVIGVVAVCSTLALGARHAPPASQQDPLTFRALTILVPVDVRVLDREGKPVTDLTQEDFTVLENGVRQPIRHFVAQAYEPLPLAAGSKPTWRSKPTPSIPEQKARIFLLVLGRGRLQVPAKGVDAVIHMVRDRLLPQDMVAVLAYNRSTDFTTDHASILQVLDRFKRRHERIEASLKQAESGLAAVYGSGEIPTSVQAEIDRVFRGDEAVGSRRVTAPPPSAEHRALDERAATDSQRTAEALLLEGGAGSGRGLFEDLARAGAPLPFDAFVQARAQTMQDIGNLYAGIEYLRYIEGEKHLVFLTEQGLYLPRIEAGDGLAARASDARVVIDTIQTGGIDTGPSYAIFGSPMPSPAFTAMDAARISGLRALSASTGGMAAAREYAAPAVDRIDAATRFAYVLGYHPSANAQRAQYRRIVVRVNRPGVTVLYRHGYYRVSPPAIDRRVYLTQHRIAAAGYHTRDVTDIRMEVRVTPNSTSQPRPPEQPAEVLVELRVDPATVAFTVEDDRHVASLDVAVYCADAQQRLVGQMQQRVDLKLRPETYREVLSAGIPYEARIRVRMPPKYVKAIVYDYAADHVGSRMVKIK